MQLQRYISKSYAITSVIENNGILLHCASLVYAGTPSLIAYKP